MSIQTWRRSYAPFRWPLAGFYLMDFSPTEADWRLAAVARVRRPGPFWKAHQDGHFCG